MVTPQPSDFARHWAFAPGLGSAAEEMFLRVLFSPPQQGAQGAKGGSTPAGEQLLLGDLGNPDESSENLHFDFLSPLPPTKAVQLSSDTAYQTLGCIF